MGKDLKGSIHVPVEVLPWYLPRGTEESSETP
jgi:hypothetical protein